MKKNTVKSSSLIREKNQDKFNFHFSKAKLPAILFIMAIFCLSPLYAQRNPININIIIDSSASLSNVKEDVESWLSLRLNEILVAGDSVTLWSAGAQARVIYSGSISAEEDKEAVKAGVRNINPSGYTADFSGALREAAARQGTGSYSYTLLISASAEMLSSLITGPNGNLLRYSRVEDFSLWRALVIGLNIDSRVRTAAASFMNN